MKRFLATLSALILPLSAQQTPSFTPAAKDGSNISSPSTWKTNLSLTPGVNVQAYDADLTTWAGITAGTGVGTFLATPSSANLASAITNETGSGALVFGTSPTLTTPALGTPSAVVLTNATGLPSSQVTGALGFTPLSGDIGFYEDFTRYADGTTIVNGSTPLVGNAWRRNVSHSTGVSPTVIGGAFGAASNTDLWYIGSTVNTVGGKFSFGCELNIVATATPSATNGFSFNMSFDSDQMINPSNPEGITATGTVHCNISDVGITQLEYYPGGGTFTPVNRTYTSGSYAFHPSITNFQMGKGQKIAVLVEVEGTTMTITLSGIGSIIITEPDLQSHVGTTTHFWIEGGGDPAGTYKAYPTCSKVWANAPSLNAQFINKNFNPAYANLVNQNNTPQGNFPAYVRFSDIPGMLSTDAPPAGSKIQVAGVSTTTVNGINVPVYGHISAEGRFYSNMGTTGSGGAVWAPGVHSINTSVTSATSSATTGSLVTLKQIRRLESLVAGERQRIEIIGNLATGTKTVTLSVLATGDVWSSGSISTTGPFKIVIYRKLFGSSVEQWRVEFWAGTTLADVSRPASFNNGNYYPINIDVTQDTGASVVVDDVLSDVVKF